MSFGAFSEGTMTLTYRWHWIIEWLGHLPGNWVLECHMLNFQQLIQFPCSVFIFFSSSTSISSMIQNNSISIAWPGLKPSHDTRLPCTYPWACWRWRATTWRLTQGNSSWSSSQQPVSRCWQWWRCRGWSIPWSRALAIGCPRWLELARDGVDRDVWYVDG